MGYARVDWTQPSTVLKAASLPFYGQAEAAIRSIDPLWKYETGELRPYTVTMGIGGCDCDCPHCTDNGERKLVIVEAISAEEAEHEALDEFPSAEILSVEPTGDWRDRAVAFFEMFKEPQP